MKNIIHVNNKTIPIQYTKQVKHIKLFIQWDEFYVKAHPNVPVHTIEREIQTQTPWMEKSLKKYEKEVKRIKQQIQNENLTLNKKRTKKELRQIINKYLEKYSHLGRPQKIFIRDGMNISWATHSINHNLSFNINLLYVPEKLIEYNVYHELCHFHEWNHTPRFYKLMKKQYPQYEEYDKLANAYSYLILHDNT